MPSRPISEDTPDRTPGWHTGIVRAIFGDSGHFVFDREGRIELAVGSPSAVGQRVQAEWRPESNIWMMAGTPEGDFNAYPWVYARNEAGDVQWLGLREVLVGQGIAERYPGWPILIPASSARFNDDSFDDDTVVAYVYDLRWAPLDGLYLAVLYSGYNPPFDGYQSDLYLSVWSFVDVPRGQWGNLLATHNITRRMGAPYMNSPGEAELPSFPYSFFFPQMYWSQTTDSIYLAFKNDIATETAPWMRIIELSGISTGAISERIILDIYNWTDEFGTHYFPDHPYGNGAWDWLMTGPLIYDESSETLVIGHNGGNNLSGEDFIAQSFDAATGEWIGFTGFQGVGVLGGIATKALARWVSGAARFLFIGFEPTLTDDLATFAVLPYVDRPGGETEVGVIYPENGTVLNRHQYFDDDENLLFAYSRSTDRILIRGERADNPVILDILVSTLGDQPDGEGVWHAHYYMVPFNMATWEWGERSNLVRADFNMQDAYWVDADHLVAAVGLGEMLLFDPETYRLSHIDGHLNVKDIDEGVGAIDGFHRALAQPRPTVVPILLSW